MVLLGVMLMRGGGHGKPKASLLHQEVQGYPEHPWDPGYR